jgi:hypothetical protein
MAVARPICAPRVMGIIMVAFSWLFAGVSMVNPLPLPMVAKMSKKLIANTASKNTWQ